MIKNWPAVLARVRAALIRRGSAEHEAEDLVQEAWVRLATYEREQAVEQPEAFLMRAAINLSIDAHRTRAQRGEEVGLDDDSLVDPSPSAESALLARERLAHLSVFLGRLSHKNRAMFLARRIDGTSYQAIAKKHGLSVSAVEKRVASVAMLLTMWMKGW